MATLQRGRQQDSSLSAAEGRAVISVPWRRTGGKSALNKHHLYEPGERELVTMFNALFRKVDVFYQYFEESAVMTMARGLRIRRFLGLDRNYADLTRGRPEATARLRIGPVAKGMKLGLIIAASGKKTIIVDGSGLQKPASIFAVCSASHNRVSALFQRSPGAQ